MGHRPAGSWAKPPTEPACPPPRAGKLRLNQLRSTKFQEPRTKFQARFWILGIWFLDGWHALSLRRAWSFVGWVESSEPTICRRGGFRRLHPPYKPQGVPPG